MSTSREPPGPPSLWPSEEDGGGGHHRGVRWAGWRRHPGVVAGAVLAAVLLAALAVSSLTETGQRDPGLRVEEVEDGDDDNEGDADSDEETPLARPGPRLVGTTLPTIVWPFERSELVVLTIAEADADQRRALAEELAEHDATGPARVLSPGEVTAQVGEAQGDRLRRRGLGGAVLVDVPGGRQARQAARQVLPTHSPERSDDTRPERPYADARIGHTIVPGCQELARSAALMGTRHARGLLDDAHCGYFDVVAAGPQAEEPWVVVARLGPTPPHRQLLEGEGKEDGSGSEPRTDREHASCLEIFTVRAARGEWCRRGQGERLRGLLGTGWGRRPPVLAGLAPEGTTRVTADGEPLSLASGLGDVPVFGGPLAPESGAVTVRALDGEGRLLDERELGPTDLLGEHAPGRPRPPPRPGPTYSPASPSWVFERVDEAMVLLRPGESVQAVRDELGRDDAVVQVERIGQATLHRAREQTAVGPLPGADQFPERVGLRAITTTHEAAHRLATLGELHEVSRVYAPTCRDLPATAIGAGVDHANALLNEAGCDVAVLDAGDDPYRLAVAVVEDGQACVIGRVGPAAPERHCRTHGDDIGVYLRATEPGTLGGAGTPAREAQLVHGLAPAATTSVELRAGDETHSVEPVAVTDRVSGFGALLDSEEVVHATARDADGDVLDRAEYEPR